ncbi:MAG: trigger factor [Actinomycetia bacterium]|nr:trigger factor [Actinomycetes bacterium]
MKSTVENTGPTRVKLAVEVPFTELEPAVKTAYRKIANQLQVPGFRPGKVPTRIIDQRVGRAAVLEEAINDALPRLYTEVVRANDLATVGQPEVEVTNLDDGQSLSFTAEVDVRPQITVPDLSAIAITVDDGAITEEDIDDQLGLLRDRFGSLSGVDRPIENDDYVSIDLKTTLDGEDVEEGSATNLSYQVGGGDLIDGLDEALAGKSAGDSAQFTTTLSGGEHAGEQAEVTVTVNSVKRKDLPEPDDEFAQMASEFDTIDELRADLRARLTQVAHLRQSGQARDKLIEQLVAMVDFPLPQSAVEAEMERREHEVTHMLGHDEALFANLLERQGQTHEEFTAKLRESANESVKLQFLLDAIAANEQVSVGDAELTEFVVRESARYELSPKQFADQLVSSGALPEFVADLRRSKTVAMLLSTATVTDTSGAPVDLAGLTSAALAELDDDEDHEYDQYDDAFDDAEDDGYDGEDADESDDAAADPES